MEEFGSKKEFWYFVGTVSFGGLFLVCLLSLLILFPICEDLTNRINDQQKTIDSLSFDASRYKAMYEDYYDMHDACIASGGEYVCQNKNVEQ